MSIRLNPAQSSPVRGQLSTVHVAQDRGGLCLWILALSKSCVSTTILHAQVSLYHPLLSVASPAQIPIAEACLGLPGGGIQLQSLLAWLQLLTPVGFTCCLLLLTFTSIELLRLCSVSTFWEKHMFSVWPPYLFILMWLEHRNRTYECIYFETFIQRFSHLLKKEDISELKKDMSWIYIFCFWKFTGGTYPEGKEKIFMQKDIK